MTYQPKPGDYGVLATNGNFARLIQVGTLSPWNHAIIYIGVLGMVDGWIAEATPRGVILSHISKYDGGRIAWNQHEEITDIQRSQVLNYGLLKIGDPYDFIDIGILAFRILGLRLPHLFTGYVAKSKGLICSELVAKAYKMAGITLVEKDDNLVTPRDLAVRLIYQ